MLDYEVFIDELVNILKQELGTGYDVHTRIFCQNNGIKTKGIFISEDSSELAECFVADPYYEICKTKQDTRLAAADIRNSYKKRRAYGFRFPAEKIYEWDFVKDKMMFRLIHTKANRELLQKIPHFEFCDLSQVFYLLIEEDERCSKSILISHKMLEIWNIHEAELRQYARKNTPVKLPARFLDTDLSASENITDVSHAYSETGGPVCILTNCIKLYGAACLLYDGILESIAKKLGCGFYVLPASVHEVILIPSSACSQAFAEKLKHLVMSVNLEVIPKKDILSDTVYYYSKEEKVLLAVL